MSVEVVNLDGLTLGEEIGSAVYIDIDAAGSGWFVDASPADNAEFSIHIDPHAIAAAAGSVAYGKMDLVTVVMHEIGHVLGLEHADAAQYAVMHEDLDLGVRYLLDQRELNIGPTAQTGDQTLLRLAFQSAGYDALGRMSKPAASTPAFDFDPAGSAGISGGIDWNDRFLGGWATMPSPFGNSAARSAPNFTDFLAKVLGSNGDKSGDDGEDSKLDKMGSALNTGKYAKAGKGATR